MKNKIFVMNTIIILLSAAAFVIGQDSALKQANKHFDRGIAAVESALTKEDLEDAVKEFEKAKSFAMDWADVYYNLGIVFEKLDKYKEAIENLQHYLRLSPNAEDTEEVQTMINKIEYKNEKASEKQNKYKDLVGTWDRYDSETGEKLNSYTISYNGNDLEVQTFTYSGNVSVPVNLDGNKLNFKYLDKQSLYDSEVEYNYTVVDPKNMKGSIRVNVIRKNPGFPIQLGLKPAAPMEMRKR
jgi:tetratricopeptide (TPR) repeat protein